MNPSNEAKKIWDEHEPQIHLALKTIIHEFNQIGIKHKSTRHQLAFLMLVIRTLIGSIKCPPGTKIKMLNDLKRTM